MLLVWRPDCPLRELFGRGPRRVGVRLMAAMMAMASLLAALLPALALVTATHPVHRHTRSWSKPPTQIESGHFPDSP